MQLSRYVYEICGCLCYLEVFQIERMEQNIKKTPQNTQTTYSK